MSQLFTLKLTDGTESVDFMGEDYMVMEGGFNISSPRKFQDLAILRPGPFFIPTSESQEPREATVKFAVAGEDRSDILEKIAKIRRILRKAEARQRLEAGNRIELQYAWEGSDQITYFEVYGGQIKFADDVLSVDKVHFKLKGDYCIPEVELVMNVSTNGYAISVMSGSPVEVKLYNPSVGSPQIGGVNIENPKNEGSSEHYNWVEIEDSEVMGSEPYLTKIKFTTDPTYWQGFNKCFIGLRKYPTGKVLNYPQKLIFEDNERDGLTGWGVTEYTDSLASGTEATPGNRTYTKFTSGASEPGVGFYGAVSWELEAISTVGMFYAICEGFYAANPNVHLAVGIDDYVHYMVRWVGDFNKYSSGSDYRLDLGPIQIPPGGRLITYAGDPHPDLWISLFVGWEIASPLFYLDFLYLLPIDDGFRIWMNRGVTASNMSGNLVDDSWVGILYRKEISGNFYASTPMFGLLESIRLEPGADQRLYFHMYGKTVSPDNHYHNKVKVQVYVVPTYMALAT